MKKKDFKFRFGRESSVAILSQVRLIDARRFKYKVGDLKVKDFVNIKSKIRQLLV